MDSETEHELFFIDDKATGDIRNTENCPWYHFIGKRDESPLEKG